MRELDNVLILGDPESVAGAVPLTPFCDSVIDFFNDLSSRLVKVREFSDVATFGFWCRKASLLKEKEKYSDLELRLGKGVVFHSTPSNVPVNFAFSFAAGLLAGNAGIVRLPGKDFEQVGIITEAIRELIKNKHVNLAPYICFVKYPPDRALHDKFSALCDVRVIWGGDNTIAELRRSPLNSRATELTFADRYSIAVINADEYIKAKDKDKIARDFYNDTYFSDQNACTSPMVVFWLGERTFDAKEVFWESVRVLAADKYRLEPVQAVGKLAAFYNAAANNPVELECVKDNYVTRIKAENISDELMCHKYNSGFFFEQDIKALNDILPICSKRLQTLTYYGLSKEILAEFIAEHRPMGIDRAVPFGQSLDFSLTWDGYDLICCLSRKIIVI